MAQVRIEESAEVAAPPQVVWDILTDYREGHPRILPGAFGPLRVEQGGQGDGTIIRFDMTVMGSTTHFHQSVSTPEPGRVLVESDVDGPNHTTFALTPHADGRRTRVTITSDVATPSGVMGAIQAGMIRLLIPPIFRDELGRLQALAGERAVAAQR